MVRLSFLYLTSVTNRLGVSAAAAVGIASKYDVFAMLPATSAASALTAVVAQNYGAGKYKRMNQALAVAIFFEMCIRDRAITVERPWETDEEKCIYCMRCVKICPAHARKLDPEKLAGLAERLKNVCAGRKENQLYLR